MASRNNDFPARAKKLPDASVEQLDKPLLIWDGQCGFCHYWVLRWEMMTGEKVDYETYQEVGEKFPEIPEKEFQKAAFLIEPDGDVFRGMGAAFRTFTYGGPWGFLFHWYNRSALFHGLMDRIYKWIALHRPFMYQLTRLMWGKNPARRQPYWLIYLLGLAAALFLLASLL